MNPIHSPSFSPVSEKIANTLRARIIMGELTSRQPLRQDDIAADFGVSKIPVREALVQLKAEGLVTFYPNRGAVVSELSAAEADEIYIMRIALEIAILTRSIPRLTIADLQRSEGILANMDREGDPAKWGELNWAFHSALYLPAGLPRILDTIHTLHINVTRYLVLYLAGMDHQETSQKEHRTLLETCRYGNSVLAAACLEGHLASAAKQLTDLLSRNTNLKMIQESIHENL